MVLARENIFQGETDPARLRCSIDKERAWAIAGRDVADELLDLPPRRNPFSPRDVSKCDCRSNNRAKQKPKHPPLIFAQAIAETAHGLDHIARCPKFLAQAAHVRIDGARVNDTFVTPDVVE